MKKTKTRNRGGQNFRILCRTEKNLSSKQTHLSYKNKIKRNITILVWGEPLLKFRYRVQKMERDENTQIFERIFVKAIGKRVNNRYNGEEHTKIREKINKENKRQNFI